MLSGFINILKPTGVSSSDVVVKVKKILGTKKVGHLGTLDPAASGVLPIAVGKATKFFDYFLKKDKKYLARVQFGIETDTLDSFGTITKVNPKIILESDINSVLKNFLGEIPQTPPKYSAIKINGKKACDLARKKENFSIKPRKTTIFSIKMKQNCGKNEFLFEVHCSAGTYIRTLFQDIAAALGTVAITPVIIRTKSGKFEIDKSVTLSEFETDKKLNLIENMIDAEKIVEANTESATKLINGVKISKREMLGDLTEGSIVFITYCGKTIGLYEVKNNYLEKLIYLYEGDKNA